MRARRGCRPSRSRRARPGAGRCSDEMPPMFDMPATPAITSTSPSSARLCASNSAMRLAFFLRRDERIDPLRDVAHRQRRPADQLARQGRLQHRGADHAFRHAELVHHVGDETCAFAEREKPLDRARRRLRRRLHADAVGRDPAGELSCRSFPCIPPPSLNRGGYWRSGSPPTSAPSRP